MISIRDQPISTPKHTTLYTSHIMRSYLESNRLKKSIQELENPEYIIKEQGYVYGTNIKVNQTIQKIKTFILKFQIVQNTNGQQTHVELYKRMLEQAIYQNYTIQIDCSHMYQFQQSLYLKLIYFPAQLITLFDNCVKQLYRDYYQIEVATERNTIASESLAQKLITSFKNIRKQDKINVKNLHPKYLGKLVSIKGIVISTSQNYPQMKTAVFICEICMNQLSIQLVNARVQQPKHCPNCRTYDSLQLIHNMCKYTDKQYIKFQQLPENIDQGQTPASIKIIAYDSNVDCVQPGDKLQIIGIYRSSSLKVNRNKSNLKSIFNTYIDLLSLDHLEGYKQKINTSPSVFSEEQIKKFRKIAEKQNIKEFLVKSFAPSIFANQIVKLGVLAQLFGGSKKQLNNDTKFRDTINVCLIGDPSTSKSQMLQQVYKIASRGIYTCGRGSSAQGLTAVVKKDLESGQFVLQSGALVLSDQGICCIDEFDKSNDNMKTILLQAMQQQTISIAKAGIVCQLNTRTSVLIAANPISSKYDTTKSIVQNINLPAALLSRFDLIYIILDIANEESDRKLAQHILSLYTQKNIKKYQNKQLLSKQQLARYISYSRQYYQPKISQEASLSLQTAYLRMRNASGNSKDHITATPRQLQSLIRISQAFAKMELTTRVTSDHVNQALKLIQQATLASATDPQTGIVDIQLLTIGKSSRQVKDIYQIASKIKAMMQANNQKYSNKLSSTMLRDDYSKTYPKCQKVTQMMFQNALKQLASEDYIHLWGDKKKHQNIKIKNIII